MSAAHGAGKVPEARFRRFRGLLFLGWACLALAADSARAQWGAWMPAEHPGLRWEGRVRFNPDRSAVFDWASVRAHAGFEGTAVAVYARPGRNYLDVLIDGRRVAVLGPPPEVADAAWAALAVQPLNAGGIPAYRIAGLEPGRHRLTLAKRTGPNFGPATLLGLRFSAESKLLAPPPARRRRIEFIGDSLVNGYGNEGPGLKCRSLAPYENSSLSWARLTAEALQAEAHLVAYSGYGLVRNYGEAGRDSDDPLPHYYPRSVLAEAAAWDRERFVPDLAVVFLGTNDYSTQPAPTAQAFEDAYAAFLDQLRLGREGMKVMVAYPDGRAELAKRGKSVVDSQQAVGHWVEGLVLPQAGQEELGCDWHPKAAVHQRWSGVAVARIRKMMKW